jgi:hypothetical protein
MRMNRLAAPEKNAMVAMVAMERDHRGAAPRHAVAKARFARQLRVLPALRGESHGSRRAGRRTSRTIATFVTIAFHRVSPEQQSRFEPE